MVFSNFLSAEEFSDTSLCALFSWYSRPTTIKALTPKVTVSPPVEPRHQRHAVTIREGLPQKHLTFMRSPELLIRNVPVCCRLRFVSSQTAEWRH